jgi:hypothetical protein
MEGSKERAKNYGKIVFIKQKRNYCEFIVEGRERWKGEVFYIKKVKKL